MSTHPDSDSDFRDFLQTVVDYRGLYGPALGITKRVIDEGLAYLSAKQQHVFTKYVLEEHTVPECSRCNNDIPWSEMQHALDNGHLCSWCWKMSTNDD
jgi:hypothetical protein